MRLIDSSAAATAAAEFYLRDSCVDVRMKKDVTTQTLIGCGPLLSG